MPAGTTFANDLLKKVLQDIDFSWDANTNLYLSLHTASPGAGGSQTTNEAAYGSYARYTIARDATGFDVSSNVGSNDDLIQFPTATSGSETITYVCLGTAASGTGQILAFGALTSSVLVTTNITPQFAANAVTWTVT